MGFSDFSNGSSIGIKLPFIFGGTRHGRLVFFEKQERSDDECVHVGEQETVWTRAEKST
jgi:hypothetical protein